MLASRLLHIVLLLQNRGLMTAPRTSQRDIDALTEAGLPVITHRGAQGGVELGFNYRTRLTGLAADEAEALALWLSDLPPTLVALGLGGAARRVRAKFQACPIPAAPSRRPPPQGFRWTTAWTLRPTIGFR